MTTKVDGHDEPSFESCRMLSPGGSECGTCSCRNPADCPMHRDHPEEYAKRREALILGSVGAFRNTMHSKLGAAMPKTPVLGDPAPNATIRVNVHDMARVLHDLLRSKTQVTELQARGTALVNEKRGIDWQNSVRLFMRTFDQPISDMPGDVPSKPGLSGKAGDDLIRFRLDLLAEEVLEKFAACLRCDEHQLLELKSAIKALIYESPVELKIIDAIDASIDIGYVNQGFRDTLGLDSGPFLQIVQKHNMAKAGPDGRPVRDPETGKVLKPEGWVGPEAAIAEELARQREEAKKRR